MRRVEHNVHKDYLNEFLRDKLLLDGRDAGNLWVSEMWIDKDTKTDKFRVLGIKDDIVTLEIYLAYLD